MDVANGDYDVILTLGDATARHEKMGVFLEGVEVDSVNTGKGEFVTTTYSVSVGDGQLTLLFRDLGGKDPYVMINALQVAVSTQPAATAFGSPDTLQFIASLTSPTDTTPRALWPTEFVTGLEQVRRPIWPPLPETRRGHAYDLFFIDFDESQVT